MAWYWWVLLGFVYIVISLFVTEIFKAWVVHTLNGGADLNWNNVDDKDFCLDAFVVLCYFFWPVMPLLVLCGYGALRAGRRIAKRIQTGGRSAKRQMKYSDAISRRDLANAERTAAEAFTAARKAEAEAASLNDGVWPPAPRS